MRVLHIKNRVDLRLLGDLSEIEFERLVVLARQHDEAEDVLAMPAGELVELVDDIAQCDKRAGALRHAHGLALVEEMHELAQLDVELGLTVAQRLYRRLHALDIAAVIGAPYIDQTAEPAAELVVVIGDVAGKIGHT